MSIEELSYPETSPLTESSDSAGVLPDERITIKEWCKAKFKPRCRVRRVKNKGAILIITWTCFITSTYFHLLKEIKKQSSSSVHYSLLAVVAVTLPLAGALADIKFGRYKVISVSLWILWLSSILLTASLVLDNYVNIQPKYMNILIFVLMLPLSVAWAAFQANVIQFGIDQLTDTTIMEYKSYFVWFCWTYMAIEMVLYYVQQCVRYELVLILVICFNASVALILNSLFNHVLIKEPATQNPFKLIYKVLVYAAKHKYPRQRSAFTYCEDDIPSRIDFGKNKYGGPFTTEQVEDVKTILRILVVLCAGCVLHSISDDKYYKETEINSIFSKYNFLHQTLEKCSSEFITNGFYYISGTLLIPLHELFLYPLFGRLLPNIKSHYKFMIGVFLHIIRLTVLLIMTTYSRQLYINSNKVLNNNATLLCIFNAPPGFLGDYLDHRWTIVPKFMYAASDLMVFVGALEFLCAQVPYSMKGLAMGMVYLFLGTFILFFDITRHQIFKRITWSTGIVSCGFWYFVTKLLLLVTLLIVFGAVMKLYKKRKRDDVLPNDHMFAERYYSY